MVLVIPPGNDQRQYRLELGCECQGLSGFHASKTPVWRSRLVRAYFEMRWWDNAKFAVRGEEYIDRLSAEFIPGLFNAEIG